MKRFLPLLLSATASIPLLLLLFPRHDYLAGRNAFSIDREQIVAASRQFSLKNGVDTTGWTAYVKPDYSWNRSQAVRYFPQDPVLQDAITTPARVFLVSSDNSDSVQALVGPKGEISLWKRKASLKTGIGPAPDPSQVAEDFKTFTRSKGDYKPVAQAERSFEGYRYAWEWISPTGTGIRSNVELVYRNGMLVLGSCSLNIADSLLTQWRATYDSTTGFLITVLVLIGFLSFAAGTWFFFHKLLVRKDHVRHPIRIAIVLLLLSSAWQFTSAYSEFSEEMVGGLEVSPLAILFGNLLTVVLRVGAIYLFLAAGYSLLSAETREKWLGLHLAARGRIKARRFGEEVLAGMLAGPVLVLSIVLFVSGGWKNPVQTHLHSASFLLGPAPVLASVSGLLAHDVTTFFPLLIPLAAQFIRSAWLRFGLLAGIGLVGFTAVRQPLETGGWTEFAAGGLLLTGVWLVYSRFGLLAAWFASFSCSTVVLALSFLSQGASGLQLAGWQLSGLWILILIGSGAVAAKGKFYEPASLFAEMQPAESELTRSERQRLSAEFEVARKAQQNMLPAHGPSIPGASVSASCRPALEVGGDFYDYPPLPDGRYALCVADVSGKGVPAALYMTLSKGILAAAVRDTGDIVSIARNLNLHLHAQGKNRTFVTMALAAYDPVTRELEYLRAGHNPILWYRAQTSSAAYIQPPGLGLGIASALRFDRIASSEILRLAEGDTVVFYSDGLTEAMNRNSDLFGEDRLKAIVERHAGSGTAESLQNAILEEVEGFTAGAPPHDDLTILILHVHPNELR